MSYFQINKVISDLRMATKFFSSCSSTDQSMYRSTNWRRQLKFCKGFPHWAPFFVSLVNRIGLPLDKMGCGYIFLFSPSLLCFFDFVKMFSTNTVSIIRIVEYSKISVLEFFEDTLANVGLTEAWLEWGFNFVTRIKKQLSLIKSKNNWV